MSVDEELIRLDSPAVESLQEHPETLIDLIEDLIDEFTIWLLTDRNEPTALCDAVVVWRDTQELIGAQHGQGFAYATYQSPQAVSAIAGGLDSYPKRDFEKRFLLQAEQFRQAAAPYFKGDQEILAYQQGFFELLRRFFLEAARGNEFLLHLIV